MKNGAIELKLETPSATVTAVAAINLGDLQLPFEQAAQLYLKPLWEQAQREFYELLNQAEAKYLAEMAAAKAKP